MKAKIGFALGMMFSVGVLAQSVQDAWNNTPQSCDTGCAMNSVASVTGSQSGNSAWETIWTGNSTGTVSYPTSAKFVAITYFIDWNTALGGSWDDAANDPSDRYDQIIITGDGVNKKLIKLYGATCSSSPFGLEMKYGASAGAAFGGSVSYAPGNCGGQGGSVYIKQIDIMR